MLLHAPGACLQQWQVPIRAQAGDHSMPLLARCSAGLASAALRCRVQVVQPANTTSGCSSADAGGFCQGWWRRLLAVCLSDLIRSCWWKGTVPQQMQLCRAAQRYHAVQALVLCPHCVDIVAKRGALQLQRTSVTYLP